jgi:hypothetical protein
VGGAEDQQSQSSGCALQEQEDETHHGPLSQLKVIESTLFHYIFELRDQRVGVARSSTR